jgi:hypothetical protein
MYQLIDAPAERSPDAGVERDEVFEQLGAMGEQLLKAVGLAAERNFVDFADLG